MVLPGRARDPAHPPELVPFLVGMRQTTYLWKELWANLMFYNFNHNFGLPLMSHIHDRVIHQSEALKCGNRNGKVRGTLGLTGVQSWPGPRCALGTWLRQW